MNRGAIVEVSERLVSALIADPGVQAIFGNPPRIYEDVPDGDIFPYITIAMPSENSTPSEGIDLSEIFPAFDVWSGSEGGAAECSAGASAIRNALNNPKRFETDHYSVGSVMHRVTRGPWRDPDGITWHAQITFRAGVEALGPDYQGA